MNAQPKGESPVKLICVILGVITFALYLPTLRHEFIAYDDQQYVYENLNVSSGLSWKGLLWSFGYHAGNWHPLTWLSHMLDCQLYGLNPAGHHLTNVLLHTANTIFLFLFLLRMTSNSWGSAFVAALFGWHPLHVESVAWVAERKDLLCAFFWMLTLWAYANYAPSSGAPPAKTRTSWYVTALSTFTLAIMSKPMAVTLPFVLLLLDFWPLNRFATNERKQAISRLLLEKAPFFILAAAACFLTLGAQEQAIVSTAGLSATQRVWHALAAYAHYIGAMVFPRGLSIYYPYIIELPVGRIVLAGLLSLTITIVALRLVRTRPQIIMGWFWYLGTLVPVIGLVQVGDQAWADRYTYLPLIGLFIPVVWIAMEALQHRPKLLVGLATATSLALLTGTSLQLRHWRNTRTLFTHAAKVVPDNYMAITMIGSILAREGKLDEAMEHYQRALRIKPGFPEAHFFLGNALDQKGDLDQAIAEYRQALWFKPFMETPHVLLGIALGKKNRLQEATQHLLEAIKINPDSSVAHNSLARIRHMTGELDEAIEHYTIALRLDPNLAQAQNNLGVLLLQKGRLPEGIMALRESLRLNPTNTESQLNLAFALNQQSNWVEAADYFTKSVGPMLGDSNAHYQFGVALYKLGKTKEATREFASALLLRPDFPEALDGLAWILSTSPDAALRNGKEAVAMAERANVLTKQIDPIRLRTLAAAYAEAGRFREAIKTLQLAKQRAAESNHREAVYDYEQMQAAFERNTAWRSQ